MGKGEEDRGLLPAQLLDGVRAGLEFSCSQEWTIGI